jgi:hypothetical protein
MLIKKYNFFVLDTTICDKFASGLRQVSGFLLVFRFMVGLWCLTPLSTLFQLYRGGQFYLVEETGVPEERVHITMSGIRTKHVSGDRHRFHR